MSDDDTTSETETPNEENLRVLREKAKQAEEAARENEQLKRQLMFTKAGIDIDSKVGGMLYKTWEGDDVDALKAEAVDLGLVGKPAEAVPQQEAESQQEMRERISGGRPAGGQAPETKHPVDEAYEMFHGALKQGTPRDDAQLIAIDKVLTAGVSGDKRVIFDQERWDRDAMRYGHRPPVKR